MLIRRPGRCIPNGRSELEKFLLWSNFQSRWAGQVKYEVLGRKRSQEPPWVNAAILAIPPG